MIKTILVEKKVFDTDKIKSGQKIVFTYRTMYYNYDDWSNPYDCGTGFINYVDNDIIEICYNGYFPNNYISLTPDDLESGFYKIDIL